MKNNYNILVIDDSLTTLLLMEWHLKEHGYNIMKAIDAEDAMGQLENLVPNLIILDLQLPGKSGYDFLKMIKFDREKMNIPVFVVSALNSKETIRKVLLLGANGFMHKPINMKGLCEKIDNLLKFELLKQGIERS
jgi:DNA-binding response OmpR family regulator